MHRNTPRMAMALGTVLLCITTPLVAQIPDTFQNLQVLDENITRDSLLSVMRGFSFALGVRCQYCHVGGDGISFEGVEFHKDDDPHKRKARYMLRMVRDLNQRYLAEMPDLDAPPVVVECKTCHRGNAKPYLLRQEMRAIIDGYGVDSAVAFYRSMRERAMGRGRYDFGEWETNVLAERLERDGHPTDAIAIYLLNEHYYPESTAIQLNLGRLYEARGDTTAAIRHYERALSLSPDNRRASERLHALRPQDKPR